MRASAADRPSNDLEEKGVPKEEAGVRRETMASRLAEAFARHGVEVVFGQSIPSLFFLAAPAAGIRQVSYRAENAGGAMADAYARITHKVGVVAAQNGPAATLLVPPLAEALKASIAMVAVVQDIARNATDKNAFQELDHPRLFEACTKWTRRVECAERLEDYVDMAFTAATSGRPGPAVLLVPFDLFAEAAPKPSPRRAELGRFPLDRTVAEPTRLEEAARLIAEARSPIVIAGGGIHVSGASAELAALQDAFHLPVATTAMGKGAVAETHPLSLGVVGYFMGDGSRTRDLRDLVRRADVVLLAGTRTNQNGTDSWTLLPEQAKYIHLDIAPEEIGRNYEAQRLTGDAQATLTALHRALATRDTSKRHGARRALEDEIRDGVARWRETYDRIAQERPGPVRPERVMHALDARMDESTIIVADASYSSIWIANYLTARRAGQRFVSPRGLAGLGWGLPFAIGAQVASPASRVVCVAGDGGFAHTWAELETLARLRLPVVTIVLNNQILGYQKHAETAFFGGFTEACDFAPVDHAAIARACGVHGLRVERGEDVGPAMAEAFACDAPVVIDVLTDPAAYPPITSFTGKLPPSF
jgi:acetolactate synthase-1/2/3 large subunit